MQGGALAACEARRQPARASGSMDSGSTIWLASSRTATSNAMPSIAGSDAEQHVTPTTAALPSRRCLARAAPAFTCRARSCARVQSRQVKCSDNKSREDGKRR